MKQILITKQDFTRIHKSISDAKQNSSIKKDEAEKLLKELAAPVGIELQVTKQVEAKGLAGQHVGP